MKNTEQQTSRLGGKLNMNRLNLAWLSVLGLMTSSISAFAEDAAHAAGTTGWAAPFAVGIGMALAVIAASTAQGRIAAAYMNGVSRNPGAQKAMGTQLILSLVFVETLVLFTFAIVYLLMGKI
jgi:F-type H+-transporting ATPase subunit c